MPRKTNINYMMRLVKKFIDDPEASRYVFEDMVYLELEKKVSADGIRRSGICRGIL